MAKDIGYELRCADPIPFDMEYTRDLGYCAAQYLLDGGTDAMVTLVDGHFQPLPFSEMLDPRTGHARAVVDTASEHYKIARRYMVRLRREDFSQPDALAGLARVIQVSTEQFRDRFGYLEGPASTSDIHPPVLNALNLPVYTTKSVEWRVTAWTRRSARGPTNTTGALPWDHAAGDAPQNCTGPTQCGHVWP